MIDITRIEQARSILNVDPGITKEELKRRYRQLLHLVHPDANPDRDVYPYTVYEIRGVQVKFVVRKHEKRRKYVDIILYVRKR